MNTSKHVLAARSFLFYLVYVVAAIAYAPVVCILGFLLPFHVRIHLIHLWPKFILLWFSFICRVNVHVNSEIDIDKIPPSVIVSNHQSTWETLYLQLLFAPSVTVLKKELFWIPFFGWALRLLEPIAIDRRKPQLSAKSFLDQGQRALQLGRHVVIFPEGTRVSWGEKRPLSTGAFRLAIDAKVAVIPVYHNAGKVWPAHQFLKYPGDIRISIGQQLVHQDKPQALVADCEQQWQRLENIVSDVPHTPAV